MDLNEMGRKGVDWIRLAQNKVQLSAILNEVLNLPVS
jgi:hypothetical protein